MVMASALLLLVPRPGFAGGGGGHGGGHGGGGHGGGGHAGGVSHAGSWHGGSWHAGWHGNSFHQAGHFHDGHFHNGHFNDHFHDHFHNGHFHDHDSFRFAGGFFPWWGWGGAGYGWGGDYYGAGWYDYPEYSTSNYGGSYYATPSYDTYESAPSSSAAKDATERPLSANAVALRILVPEDAKVWVEGEATRLKGSVRIFRSPELTPGVEYAYAIRAQWSEGGRLVEKTKQVFVHAGDRLTVDFIQAARPDAAPLPRQVR
jgi:uncharacterized protein (TIGR03000 family)